MKAPHVYLIAKLVVSCRHSLYRDKMNRAVSELKDSCLTELTTQRSKVIREEWDSMRESNQVRDNTRVGFESWIAIEDKVQSNF